VSTRQESQGTIEREFKIRGTGRLLEFAFYLPTKVYFGECVSEKLGEEAGNLGQSALIVSDENIIRKIINRKKIEDSLNKAGVKTLLWDGVITNPPLSVAEKGARFARREKCDLIIGLGGGSVIDAAKGIAVMCTNPPPLSLYLGRDRIRKPPLPLIAIPTTAGTGSEVNPYAVFTNTQKNPPQKEIMADPLLFPRIALVDPQLTLSLPSSVTADAGIDALCHAIESYTSKKSRPFSEMLALEAIHILAHYLAKAVKDPGNIKIRSYCSYASLLAGMAIAQTGTTLVHGMGYKLSAHLGITHGRANGILLPWVSEFNLQADPPRYTHLAKTLGEEIEGLGYQERAMRAVNGIRRILGEVGQPDRLKGKSIKSDTIEEFAREIMQNKRRLSNNPRLVTFKDVVGIYQKALGNANETQGGSRCVAS